MILFGHVGGVPVEEMLSAAPAAGAALLMARACLLHGVHNATHEEARLLSSSTLNIERTFQAPAQAVFDAFTSPEVMRRWWHVERDWSTAVAEVDLRLGGAVRVVMRSADGTDYGGGGVYTEIDPPRRLAFTWLWDGNDTRQLIEIDFEETAAGVTRVRFTHSGLWDEEAVRSHDGGWNASFDLLDEALIE